MITCAECGTAVDALEQFPGMRPGTARCLPCYAQWAERQPMPTASDIVRMFGGRA